MLVLEYFLKIHIDAAFFVWFWLPERAPQGKVEKWRTPFPSHNR